MPEQLPHDISAVTQDKPRFYTERELAPVREKLAAYKAGTAYALQNGTVVHPSAALTSPTAVLNHALAAALTEANQNPAGHWLSDAEALSRELEPLRDKLSGPAAVMLADVLLVFQATWANAGDNDYMRGLTGSEHLLLDLEALAPES